MDIKEVIAHLDTEIARLQEVKGILSGLITTKARLGRPTPTVTVSAPVAAKRVISKEGRARIAAAQRARWAKQKRTSKK